MAFLLPLPFSLLFLLPLTAPLLRAALPGPMRPAESLGHQPRFILG
jgi:hypothetical protein